MHPIGILVVGLAVGACITESSALPDRRSVPDGPGLQFDALSFEQRSRIVRAVIEDASTARWIARTLEARAPACAELERDAASDRLSFVARRCTTTAGATLDGAFEVFDASKATASYQFAQLRITGAGRDESIELDGGVDADPDAHHIDLVVARAGGAVQTSISVDAATHAIAEGSFVDFDGHRALVTGTLGATPALAFEGADGYSFAARGPCGRDSRGDEICMRGAPMPALRP